MRSLALPVLTRPGLWPSAFGAGRRLVPSRWWRRAPFLPLPDRRWLAFRLETAYGDRAATPRPEDVVEYLTWWRGEARRRGAFRKLERTPR